MPSYKYSVYNSARRGNRRGAGAQRPKSKRPGAQYIDPAKFVRRANPSETETYEAANRFADFNFHALLHDNLAAKGFDTPTPIQDQTIALGLRGRDVIGIADTGTGKTAAFMLPVLQTLLSDQRSKALIVAPTRELAKQIEDEAKALGRSSGLSGALLIGGVAMGGQLRQLRAEPRIVIGTPGRIKDHMERGTLKLAGFNTVVLDEVDRMLDMGFLPDVSFILHALGTPRQSFFFSATMDRRVEGLIQTFAFEPETVRLKSNDASENVHQDVIRFISPFDKLDKLHDLLNREEVTKAIIFDETQRSVERLSNELVARGFQADAIHGGKTQGQRQRALDSFKADRTKILVATDVAARGIDVADISHVINYAIPNSYQDYIHRIGRAGRAGRIGYAFTFVD